MFLILKRFILAVGASFLVSGLVNAKTSIGGGVLSLNGAISTATCNVTVSMSSLPQNLQIFSMLQ